MFNFLSRKPRIRKVLICWMGFQEGRHVTGHGFFDVTGPITQKAVEGMVAILAKNNNAKSVVIMNVVELEG